MTVIDKNEYLKPYGLILIGDTFTYDTDEGWRYYCLQTEKGAVDVMTGKMIDISPFELIEVINTKLIVER